MARNTFAITVTLSNNISIEKESRTLRNASIRPTQYYAKILDSKISRDMNELKQKIDRGSNESASSAS